MCATQLTAERAGVGHGSAHVDHGTEAEASRATERELHAARPDGCALGAPSGCRCCGCDEGDWKGGDCAARFGGLL